MSAPTSAPKRSVVGSVVPAPHGGVQRHHQPVLAGHPGHLEQHVPAQRDRLRGGRLAARARRGRCGRPSEGSSGSVRTSSWLWSADVAAAGDEVPAAGLHRRDEPRVVVRGRAGHLGQPRHPLRPAGAAELEVAIGPEGRDHAAGPRRVGGQRRVRGEVVARVVGGGQHRDPEPLEQGARPEGGLGEAGRQLVVDRVRRVGGRTALDAEDLHQLVLEPVPDGRAAEHVPVGAHPPPDVPRLRLGRGRLRDTERVERDARRVQQARHVVVGRHQQRRRVRERLIREQQARVHVSVG